MKSKDRQGKLRLKGIVLLLALLLAGCAGGGKTAAKDPFFDKWDTTAKNSPGRSPAPKAREMIIPDDKPLAPEHAKRLPGNTINLKMRQAELKAVLRSMARAAGQNLLIKNDVKGEISVDFRDVPWDQAFNSILRAQGLSYVWEGDIIRVMTVEDMEHDLKVAALKEKRISQEMGVKWVEPLLTMVINIDYSDAKSLKENLQEFLTKDKDGKPRGSVRVDEHSNSLIIQAIRDDLNRMIPIIDKIDKPTYQIMIKANIVETTKEIARNLGIQWGGMYNPRVGNHDLFVTPGGTGGSAVPPGSALSGSYTPLSGNAGISGQGFGVNFPVAGMGEAGSGALGLMFGTIGGNILDLQLNALQKDGKLEILSSPSITTLDNQKAFTENGERVPYVSVDKEGNREVKFEDAVLRLEITPHVIDGKSLKMKIIVQKDEVDTSRKVDGNPFIIKKHTETSLIVQDGETIVISGLTKQRNANTETGIPGLKNVPVLGWLFKGEEKSDHLEDVIIFITPTILKPATSVASQPGIDERK